MTAYAEPADLAVWRVFYGLPAPANPAVLLELASRDLEAHLGGRFDVASLLPEQVEALKAATSVQACFRVAMGAEAGLGVDDGVQAVAGLSFSARPSPRFSPEAATMVANIGLLLRSGTVEVEAADEA